MGLAALGIFIIVCGIILIVIASILSFYNNSQLSQLKQAVEQLKDRVKELEGGKRPLPEKIVSDTLTKKIEPVIKPQPEQIEKQQPVPVVTAKKETAPPVQKQKPQKKEEEKAIFSLESRMGLFFLMLGVTLVATSVVIFVMFFAEYIGPVGKAAIVYFVSLFFTIGGLLMERKLKLFGHGIFALGLGLIYFTTFAIYFIEPIKIHNNQMIEIILLTVVVAGIIFIADRKKSQIIAGIAIFLGFYTVMVSNITFYTLFASLLLSISSIILLIRNRWKVLPWMALTGSYLCFFLWIILKGFVVTTDLGIFWMNAGFLIAYFLLFTLTTFFLKSDYFGQEEGIAFCSINIASFYLLMLFAYILNAPGYRGYVELITSTICIIFSFIYTYKKENDRIYLPYLIGGITLTVIGLTIFTTTVSHFFQLIITAVNIAGLAALGLKKKSQIITGGALVTGFYALVILNNPLYILISALSLAVFSIILLFRNKWKYLSWIGLVGAYLSYLFLIILKQPFDFSGITGLFVCEGFLLGYFLLFSIFILLYREDSLIKHFETSVGIKISDILLFVSINIVSFYILSNITFISLYPDLRDNVEIAVSAICILLCVIYTKKQEDNNFYLPYLITGLALAPFGLMFIVPQPWIVLSLILLTAVVFIFSFTFKHRILYIAVQCYYLFLTIYNVFLINSYNLPGNFNLKTYDNIIFFTGFILSVIIMFLFIQLHERLYSMKLDAKWRKIEMNYAHIGICLGAILFIYWIFSVFSISNATVLFLLFSIFLAIYFRLGGYISAEIIAGLLLLNSLVEYLGFGGQGIMGYGNYSDFTGLTLPAWSSGLLLILAIFISERIISTYYKNKEQTSLSIGLSITGASILVFLLPVYLLREMPIEIVTISWSTAGFIMFMTGLLVKVKAYRWGGLVLLIFSIVRLAAYDFFHADNLFKVIGFMVIGLYILVVAFIYMFNREKLKNWF